MEPETTARADPGFESLRLRRAELLQSIRALEQALASPAAGRVEAWSQRVHAALAELTADFREHVALTEGSDGLYRAVLATAPRLANVVANLTADHAVISQLTGRLLDRTQGPVDAAEVEPVREDGTALLARLSRHRQRGADLVYEAYQTDIGGET